VWIIGLIERYVDWLNSPCDNRFFAFEGDSNADVMTMMLFFIIVFLFGFFVYFS
jgi:hypothetical protein